MTTNTCLRCGTNLAGLAHPHNCPGSSDNWRHVDEYDN